MKKTALTTTSVKCSHLLHVKDLISNEFFLIDSGAEISIVKSTPSEKRSKYSSELISVDGSSISTYGNRTLNLCFGGVLKFRWIFVIAEVKHNILGIDFLRHFSLTIEFASSKLKSHLSQSLFPLVTKLVCHVKFPKPFLVTNEYFETLERFPDLTRPPKKEKLIKHNVVNDIVTTGFWCHARARPLPPDKLEVVRHEIEYLLETGIISCSNSNYASPLHFIPKKNSGKFRLVGDYRNLNRQTIPDLYPTPSVQSLLHCVFGASIFSKIDLVKAYHQIPLAPTARKKTAIICPLGLFGYNTMPFGLRNASATFQRFLLVYVMACLTFWPMLTIL